jgi:hypothetical protein
VALGRSFRFFDKRDRHAISDSTRKAISVSTKKRGRPKTTGKGTPVTIRLIPPVLARLDTWAADNGLTRAEALRQFLMTGLDAEAKRKR